MSYSFVITADSKAEANDKIKEQFNFIVGYQPNHAADKEAAITVAQTFVGLLAEPGEGKEVYVSMNGSLGWHHDGSQDVPTEFLHANISVNASIRDKS